MFYDWPDYFYSGGPRASRGKLGMKLAIGTVRVLFAVVSTSPALFGLPVNITEKGTKSHLWRNKFTYCRVRTGLKST